MTDDGGGARFTVPPGLFDARVSAGGFSTFTQEGIEATIGKSSPVVIRLGAGGQYRAAATSNRLPSAASCGQAAQSRPMSILSFEVSDEKGEPLAGIAALFKNFFCGCGKCPSGVVCASKCCELQGGTPQCCPDVSVVTDAEGRFEIDAPAGDAVDLTLKKNGKTVGRFSGLRVGTEKAEIKYKISVERARTE